MEQLISKLSLDAANVVHSVMGMLELIAEEPLTGNQTKYLRACRTSVDRLHRAIRDVSELSGAKSIELADSAFDINEVTTGVASVMGSLIRSKDLRFDWEQSTDAPMPVMGDRDRIEDILVRLLDNAIRTTSHGVVTLHTRFAPLDSGVVNVQIEVSDTGLGIIPETVESSGSFLDTTNLGLFIVRQLVERMGGEMSITAAAGIGALVAVRLSLPAAASFAVSKRDYDAESGRQPLPPLNLLIAEDSDDSYILLEAFLKGQGHRLSRAVDGAQALELFKRNDYDFVLMDIRMPVMDGFTATRAMREFETAAGRRRIPIVVLSAEDTAVQVRVGATVGCTGYLMKPVSKATVLRAFHRYAPMAD